MSKMRLFKEAERLYLEDKLTPDEIALQLDISRRTIFYWKKKYEWDKHLHKKYKSEELFSIELLELARSFMRKLSNDLDNKKTSSQAEYYALTNLIKNIPEVKKYEKSVAKSNAEKQNYNQPLDPEYVRKIQKEILGWEPEL